MENEERSNDEELTGETESLGSFLNGGKMTDIKIETINLDDDEEITEDTLKELSNNKGDDDEQ